MHNCSECKRLRHERTSAEMDYEAVREDLIARFRKRLEVSDSRLAWLRSAEVEFQNAVADCVGHRADHL